MIESNYFIITYKLSEKVPEQLYIEMFVVLQNNLQETKNQLLKNITFRYTKGSNNKLK